MTTGNVTSYYYLGDRLVSLKKDTTLRFVHQDHLTGTAVITDTDGEEVGSIKYYPYGETRDSTGTLYTDKLYTGQRLDDTGLYYYGARFYDPTIGRFISADILIPHPNNPQSLNRYSYCLNNPLKYIDPTGFFDNDEIDATFGEGTVEFLKSDACDKAWYEMLRDAEWGDEVYFSFEDSYMYFELIEGVAGLTCSTAVIDGEGNINLRGVWDIRFLAEQTNIEKESGVEFYLRLYTIEHQDSMADSTYRFKKSWNIHQSWWNRKKAALSGIGDAISEPDPWMVIQLTLLLVSESEEACSALGGFIGYLLGGNEGIIPGALIGYVSSSIILQPYVQSIIDDSLEYMK